MATKKAKKKRTLSAAGRRRIADAQKRRWAEKQQTEPKVDVFVGRPPIHFHAVNDIGWAVKQLDNGLKVRRAGWNGQGMFLVLCPGSVFIVNRKPYNEVFPEGTEVTYQPHVDMFTADGTVVPWLSSQTDLLATDWELAD